jgi:hypothetical protein
MFDSVEQFENVEKIKKERSFQPTTVKRGQDAKPNTLSFSLGTSLHACGFFSNSLVSHTGFKNPNHL